MSHLDAAASRLQSATEELRTKETILQRPSANLNKLQLSDPPASEETLAKAKLGVAEAKLGVAEAKLARLAYLEKEIDLWREKYQSHSG